MKVQPSRMISSSFILGRVSPFFSDESLGIVDKRSPAISEPAPRRRYPARAMIGKPLVAATSAAVALLAAGSAHPHVTAPTKVPPLLGIVEDRAPFETLVRLD